MQNDPTEVFSLLQKYDLEFKVAEWFCVQMRKTRLPEEFRRALPRSDFGK